MNNHRIPLAQLLGLGLLAACGGEEILDVNTSAEAVVAAESAMTAAGAAEVTTPIADRDRSLSDVMTAVREQYGRRMTCADVSLNGGVLAVDFGTGCDINGHTVAGAFTVAHTRTATASSFTVTLDELSGDRGSTDGTVYVAGVDGTLSADATLMVTQGTTVSEHLFAATLAPDAQGVTLNGTASRDDGANVRNLSFAGVHVAYGDCYPDAGVITVDASGQPTTTVTFDAGTPATGEVSVQVGRLPAQTVVLPACQR